MRRFILHVAAALCAVLLVSSCAAHKRAAVEQISADAGRRLSQGDYRGALELSREACTRYPEEKALSDDYHRALEEAKKAADRAYERGDFVLAGKIYFLLRQDSPADDAAGAGLSFTKRQVHRRLDRCRARSSLEALRQYRQGNLKDAIALWKGILVFDPDNAGLKKAVQTATIQLENLRRTP